MEAEYRFLTRPQCVVYRIKSKEDSKITCSMYNNCFIELTNFYSGLSKCFTFCNDHMGFNTILRAEIEVLFFLTKLSFMKLKKESAKLCKIVKWGIGFGRRCTLRCPSIFG